jgi:hypothetical protein
MSHMQTAGAETHLEGLSPVELAGLQEWSARVAGANISARTLLATDYLNHLNEIVMLVEMLPDMPDMLDECRLWEPKTYPRFVGESTFSDRDLAVAAYEHVPAKFRLPFEDAIAKFDSIVTRILDAIEAAGGVEAQPELLQVKCGAAVAAMQDLIGVANGVIHGEVRALSQGEIDDYLAAV